MKEFAVHDVGGQGERFLDGVGLVGVAALGRGRRPGRGRRGRR